jgi:hypothetical protein
MMNTLGLSIVAMTAVGSLSGSGMYTDVGGSAIRTLAVVVTVSIARFDGQTKHPN